VGTGPNRNKAASLNECRVAVVGGGRLGTALSLALRNAGIAVAGPFGRDGLATAAGANVVLLCVPDAEIAVAAQALDRCHRADAEPLVGHCSGATDLDELAAHEGFSLHPLMTVIGEPELDVARLASASAAIAGTSPRALQIARELAVAAGMRPIVVSDADRAIYHAAAALASNFLVTLEGAAETLAADAGVGRQELLPLVRATVENWGAVGARRALTGPIARGDEATVARQRAAIADAAPQLVELFDVLCEATRELAGTPEVAAA
jgi:predicted short-subunit dehydrogenase-like oxidoreductase (DUF2520 family)